MIEEMKMYGCDCDGNKCEEFWQDPETDSIAFIDRERTREHVEEAGWHLTAEGKTYCPDCHTTDENDVVLVNDGYTPGDWKAWRNKDEQ